MKLAFFNCPNACGFSTSLNVDDVSAIVYRDDKDIVLVFTKCGKEFGFNGAEIRSRYERIIGGRSGKTPVTDLAVKTLTLLKYAAANTTDWTDEIK